MRNMKIKPLWLIKFGIAAQIYCIMPEKLRNAIMWHLYMKGQREDEPTEADPSNEPDLTVICGQILQL